MRKYFQYKLYESMREKLRIKCFLSPFLSSSYFAGTDGLYVKHTIHDLEGNSLEEYKKENGGGRV